MEPESWKRDLVKKKVSASASRSHDSVRGAPLKRMKFSLEQEFILIWSNSVVKDGYRVISLFES